MARLGELDLPRRLAPTVPVWITEIGTGFLCAGGSILLRALFDAVVVGGAPFALIFPAMILATLFARWPAGAVTAVCTILYAWYYGYPVRNSFAFATPDGPLTIAAIVLGAVLTVLIAEVFRRAARAATDERDREIAERDLFLSEFEHRVKNNFAIVAGLLDMQRRRAKEPATAEALGSALARVDSIARAHRHLYRGGDQPGTVEMQQYLRDLCHALSEALLLRGGVLLECEAEDAQVPRDRAVSMGLVVNELVTNAAKHAFTGREGGTIRVRFRNEPADWVVIVADDGIGMAASTPPETGGGLGTRLIDGFARQAGGTLLTESDATGTCVTLRVAR